MSEMCTLHQTWDSLKQKISLLEELVPVSELRRKKKGSQSWKRKGVPLVLLVIIVSIEPLLFRVKSDIFFGFR